MTEDTNTPNSNTSSNPSPERSSTSEATHSHLGHEGGADSGSTQNPPEIASLKSEVEDQKKKYMYLYAEFENFKKRTAKEQSEFRKFALSHSLGELLFVLDNFERALQHASEEELKTPIVQGIKMIFQQLQSFLDSHGVRRIEVKNKVFDPHLHDAAGNEPSDMVPEGHILREDVAGYMHHERILRPSRVTVSSGPLKKS